MDPPRYQIYENIATASGSVNRNRPRFGQPVRWSPVIYREILKNRAYNAVILTIRGCYDNVSANLDHDFAELRYGDMDAKWSRRTVNTS